ncbi:hypothetical protein HZH68_008363 [Vespula germanica]|uniref:Uncharacterized protein n=1 Tax=Vespula germanica TaxID=30212 RepID=A0A834K4A4_VESGE|nr:hypothetical protein HZH68_008363 [Vespula germanica]
MDREPRGRPLSHTPKGRACFSLRTFAALPIESGNHYITVETRDAGFSDRHFGYRSIVVPDRASDDFSVS